MLVHAAGGQTHGQTDTLLNDRALQEDVLAQLAFLTGDDGVGDLAHQVVCLLTFDVGISHACNLGEHLTADLNDRGVDSSETHSNLSLCFAEKNEYALRCPAANSRSTSLFTGCIGNTLLQTALQPEISTFILS